MKKTLHADAGWIRRRLEKINTFNDTPEFGTTRVMLTETELSCREYVKREMRDLGLEVTEDTVGNIFGAWRGREPSLAPIWTGSHIDTVLNAGMFDGMAGVVAGLEAVRLLKNAGEHPRRTLVVVVYLSEEPTRFGLSCLGSRIMAGDLDERAIRTLKDKDGETLYDLLSRLGFTPEHLAGAVKRPGEVHAALELHIEQSANLERRGKRLGLVQAICAPTNLTVTVTGRQSHAGGTSMADRRDAYMAAAEMSLTLEQLAREADKQSYTTGTVGVVSNIPGAVNVIPGKTVFSIDIRGADFAVKDAMLSKLRASFLKIAEKRDVSVELVLENHDVPARCDGRLLEVLRLACGSTPYLETISGAYHDSLFVARFAPVAMLFVPSRNGISHSPEEWTDFEDIALGAQVLAAAMLQIGDDA
ncbi:MAG: M20 family metallo-hydrolase [Intestinimonas sp.]|jgi:hydantoinase/carbamoylase family amidase|nr:M20 family metallo-hydrolase [Intestinimonas sp.]